MFAVLFFFSLLLLFSMSGMRHESFLHHISLVQELNLEKCLHVKATQKRKKKPPPPVYLSSGETAGMQRKPGLVMHFLMCCTDGARASALARRRGNDAARDTVCVNVHMYLRN